MTIIRTCKEKGKLESDGYKNIDHAIFNNRRSGTNPLSYGAKGLLAYMLSKPDDWKFNKQDLINESKDENGSTIEGEKKIDSYIKELKEAGYLEQIRTANKGKRNGFSWDWVVREKPISKTDSKSQNDKLATNTPVGGYSWDAENAENAQNPYIATLPTMPPLGGYSWAQVDSTIPPVGGYSWGAFEGSETVSNPYISICPTIPPVSTHSWGVI